MIIYIVSIGNLNYVGQTVNAYKRESYHRNCLTKRLHPNSRLQREYDRSKHFHFGIIEDANGQDQADASEKFYINYLRFLGARLANLSNGGKGVAPARGSLPAETKSKISQSLRRHYRVNGIRKHSPEAKSRTSRSLLRFYNGMRQRGEPIPKPSFKGFRHGAEARKKIGRASLKTWEPRLRGEKVCCCKLTANDVLFIRSCPLSQSEIARKFGIDQTNVSQIRLRKTWKCI
jgi:hypothetical protein